MSVEIKELQDNIATLTTAIQEKADALEARGQKTDEGMEELKSNITELSEKLQNAELKAEEEKKAREQLELSVAKSFEKAADGEIKGTEEYKSAFNSYCKKRTAIDTEVADTELKQIIKDQTGLTLSDNDFIHVKTMLVGSDPDGGYLAPVEMLSRISKRIFESSPMRSIATVITTGNEAVELPIDDQEFTSAWVAETDTRGDTDTSKLGMITIPTHEQYAMPLATQKILDDATINIETWINGKVSEIFSRTENTAFVSGDGIKKPTGFLTLADWTTLGTYERGKLETRETATASTLAADDLIDLQTDLFEFYQANATWVMARKTWAEVMKLKDGNDNYLLNPAMMFQGSLGLQLLGKPVKLFADMPDTSDGNVPIAYGDWREGYTIVDRIGIRILRDPYTSKGYVKFYTTKRVGADVTNYQAIKRLKIQAT